MKQQALIIFVRRPEKGKVKTRLAASLGDDAALSIYHKLLHHTLEITTSTNADKVVFYAGEIEEKDIWQRDGYAKRQQAEGDLGQRMSAAFDAVLGAGYSKVCIVGSDCFELTPQIIEDAFCCLDESDVVIGPAHDGGYYLLGMKTLHPQLFLGKAWSTATVFEDTMQTARQLNLTVKQLPLLRDVDEAADVPRDWLPLPESSTD